MNERDLLLLTPDFPPNRGGVARYLRLLCDHFSNRVTVVAEKLPDATPEMVAEYPILRTELLSKIVWPRWIKSVYLFWKERKTYAYALTSHALPFGTAAMVAGWFTRKLYVVIVHGMDIRLGMKSGWKRSLLSQTLSNAYLVVANSNALAAELQTNFGLRNILVVYPSIDPKFVSASIAHDPLQPFRLLTVSRLVERKGHDRVLNALATLKLNGTLTNFQYDIVGTGPVQSNLEQLVEVLQLKSHVRFLGDIDDAALASEYASADVFVMPVKDDAIDKEGFGLVYIEAAAYGVPSIGTQMTGVNEAVLDKQTGLLVENGNMEELAGAILLLATDSAYRQTLGKAAQERARMEFSSETQFSKLDPYFV